MEIKKMMNTETKEYNEKLQIFNQIMCEFQDSDSI